MTTNNSQQPGHRDYNVQNNSDEDCANLNYNYDMCIYRNRSDEDTSSNDSSTIDDYIHESQLASFYGIDHKVIMLDLYHAMDKDDYNINKIIKSLINQENVLHIDEYFEEMFACAPNVPNVNSFYFTLPSGELNYTEQESLFKNITSNKETANGYISSSDTENSVKGICRIRNRKRRSRLKAPKIQQSRIASVTNIINNSRKRKSKHNDIKKIQHESIKCSIHIDPKLILDYNPNYSFCEDEVTPNKIKTINKGNDMQTRRQCETPETINDEPIKTKPIRKRLSNNIDFGSSVSGTKKMKKTKFTLVTTESSEESQKENLYRQKIKSDQTKDYKLLLENNESNIEKSQDMDDSTSVENLNLIFDSDNDSSGIGSMQCPEEKINGVSNNFEPATNVAFKSSLICTTKHNEFDDKIQQKSEDIKKHERGLRNKTNFTTSIVHVDTSLSRSKDWPNTVNISKKDIQSENKISPPGKNKSDAFKVLDINRKRSRGRPKIDDSSNNYNELHANVNDLSGNLENVSQSNNKSIKLPRDQPKLDNNMLHSPNVKEKVVAGVSTLDNDSKGHMDAEDNELTDQISRTTDLLSPTGGNIRRPRGRPRLVNNSKDDNDAKLIEASDQLKLVRDSILPANGSVKKQRLKKGPENDLKIYKTRKRELISNNVDSACSLPKSNRKTEDINTLTTLEGELIKSPNVETNNVRKQSPRTSESDRTLDETKFPTIDNGKKPRGRPKSLKYTKNATKEFPKTTDETKLPVDGISTKKPRGRPKSRKYAKYSRKQSPRVSEINRIDETTLPTDEISIKKSRGRPKSLKFTTICKKQSTKDSETDSDETKFLTADNIKKKPRGRPKSLKSSNNGRKQSSKDSETDSRSDETKFPADFKIAKKPRGRPKSVKYTKNDMKLSLNDSETDSRSDETKLPTDDNSIKKGRGRPKRLKSTNNVRKSPRASKSDCKFAETKFSSDDNSIKKPNILNNSNNGRKQSPGASEIDCKFEETKFQTDTKKTRGRPKILNFSRTGDLEDSKDLRKGSENFAKLSDAGPKEFSTPNSGSKIHNQDVTNIEYEVSIIPSAEAASLTHNPTSIAAQSSKSRNTDIQKGKMQKRGPYSFFKRCEMYCEELNLSRKLYDSPAAPVGADDTVRRSGRARKQTKPNGILYIYADDDFPAPKPVSKSPVKKDRRRTKKKLESPDKGGVSSSDGLKSGTVSSDSSGDGIKGKKKRKLFSLDQYLHSSTIASLCRDS